MVEPPLKVPTPYGGRLVFSLPGDNNLVVHLKDKLKIRNKKRWSMVSSSHPSRLHGLQNSKKFYIKVHTLGVLPSTQQPSLSENS